MAHHICCPYQRSTERSNDTPEPCRPPITLDGTFTQGFLPQDHPHAMTGRRLMLSPVDFIMKSPRIADKIKLKMSKKSTRTLRQELDRLTESHNTQDAHALTSNEVLDSTGSGTSDAARGAASNRVGCSSRTTDRFGTEDGLSVGRLDINSPSIYSRSPSRTDGDPIRLTGTAKATSALDVYGHSYRSILPRQPSSSGSPSIQLPDSRHSQQKNVHSRHWSGSTETTIQRRMEQSARDHMAEPAAMSSSSYYTAQSDGQVSSQNMN